MKVIKKLSNGELEVEAEDILESLYEVGEFVEIELEDRQVIAKVGKRFIVK